MRPSWDVGANNGCHFDDPGENGGLGPNAVQPDVEYSADPTYRALGFGWAVGGNTGALGSGENHLHVYVR
jgi:hypothetical protein